MLRFRFARLAGAAAAFAILLSATPAPAGNIFKRAGSSIGAFFKRIGQVFRREPLDPNLVAALDSYEKVDDFTTYSQPRAVVDIRFKRELELSQTLADKRSRETKPLEGS